MERQEGESSFRADVETRASFAGRERLFRPTLPVEEEEEEEETIGRGADFGREGETFSVDEEEDEEEEDVGSETMNPCTARAIASECWVFDRVFDWELE